jgi:hypothetical protein
MAGLTLGGAAVGLHRGAAQFWRGSLSFILKLAHGSLAVALIGGIILLVEIAAPDSLRLVGSACAAGGTAAMRILTLVGPALPISSFDSDAGNESA